MDRYSRGYDERYRGYFDRPRSDTYRPGENYRSERDYRNGGVRGGRNYSPNPHYSSGNSRGGGSSGNSNDDRYSYTDSRPYYPSSRGPSPSRSDSRSPRRPSYGYYRSGPSSYPYNSRRSPSPANGGGRSRSSGRRDSYDHHRPYHNTPNYPYPYHRNSSPYPPSYSRRHYSGPPPPHPYPPSSGGSGYHSRESSVGPSSGPLHQAPPPPPSRSIHTTPTSTAPNSPGHYNNPLPPPSSSTVPASTLPDTSMTTTTSTTTITHGPTPQGSSYIPSYHYNSPAAAPSSSSSYPGTSGQSAPVRSHHHNYHHNPHYNTSYQPHHLSPSITMPPIRQRISWAPEQEKELERYHNDDRKLIIEENKILTASRKSRFELELANWDTRKLEHQLELVQKQWEENGMEELIKEELSSRLPGRNNSTSLGRAPALTISSLQIL